MRERLELAADLRPWYDDQRADHDDLRLLDDDDRRADHDERRPLLGRLYLGRRTDGERVGLAPDVVRLPLVLLPLSVSRLVAVLQYRLDALHRTSNDDDAGAACLRWVLHILVGSFSGFLGANRERLRRWDSRLLLYAAEFAWLDMRADVDALYRAAPADDEYDDDDRRALRALLHDDHDNRADDDDRALLGSLQMAMEYGRG